MRKKSMSSGKSPKSWANRLRYYRISEDQKIRVGVIPDPGIRLEPGRHIILTSQTVAGSQQRISVSYPLLNEQVKDGDRIMLADGFLELRVTSVSRAEIHCEIITGGVLTSHKGINLPTGSILMPSMTDKDRDDLHFGLGLDVDYVALSFVRTAADIQDIKEIIRRENKHTPVIAKIEKHEAIDHYDDILDAADAIMVARGDLGVEIPLEEVPGIQKRLIQKANALGKPVYYGYPDAAIHGRRATTNPSRGLGCRQRRFGRNGCRYAFGRNGDRGLSGSSASLYDSHRCRSGKNLSP